MGLCIHEVLREKGLHTWNSLADLSHRSGIPTPLVEGMLDVLVALGLLQRDGDVYSGAPDLLPLLQAPFRDALLAEVRSAYLQSREMIDAAKRRTLAGGWYYTDPEILEAQGTPGGLLFYMLAQMLFPRLDGLQEALQRPGATFLDVGTGVGAIAITIGWASRSLAASWRHFPGCWDGRRRHCHNGYSK